MKRMVTASTKTNTSAGKACTRSRLLQTLSSPSAEAPAKAATITAKHVPTLQLQARVVPFRTGEPDPFRKHHSPSSKPYNTAMPSPILDILSKSDFPDSRNSAETLTKTITGAMLQVNFPGVSLPGLDDAQAINIACQNLFLPPKKDGSVRAGRIRCETLATGDLLMVKYVSGRCIQHALYTQATRQVTMRFYANGCGQTLAKLRAAKVKEAKRGHVKPRYIMIASTNDLKTSSSLQASIKGPDDEAVVKILDLKTAASQKFDTADAASDFYDFTYRLNSDDTAHVERLRESARAFASSGHPGAYGLLWTSFEDVIAAQSGKPTIQSYCISAATGPAHSGNIGVLNPDELPMFSEDDFCFMFETMFRSCKLLRAFSFTNNGRGTLHSPLSCSTWGL